MAYGSTPYVGISLKKMVVTLYLDSHLLLNNLWMLVGGCSCSVFNYIKIPAEVKQKVQSSDIQAEIEL